MKTVLSHHFLAWVWIGPKVCCWACVPESHSIIKEASLQVQEWHLSCWNPCLQYLCESLLFLFRQDCVNRIFYFAGACVSVDGWGWGGRRRNMFLVLTVPFAPFANRLAGCPRGATLMLRCIGFTAHFKNEKIQLAYCSSTKRLAHQAWGNHDFPITISEGSELLAKTFLTFKICYLLYMLSR